MLKTLLSVLAVLVLASTTSFAAISQPLVVLRVPKIICLQPVMTYRYLSTLFSEAAAMFTAYTLRPGNPKGIALKDIGSFLGQLILRNFDRADRVYQAMNCCGFDSVYREKKHGPFRRNALLFTNLTPPARRPALF